jgi:hypothetical protein
MYPADIRCNGVDYSHLIKEYTKYSSLRNVRIPQASEYFFVTLAAKVLTKNFGLRYRYKYYHRPIFTFTLILFYYGGRDSVVCITRCGLDISDFESRWGRDYPHSARPALRLDHFPVQLSPRLFHVGKTDGA